MGQDQVLSFAKSHLLEIFYENPSEFDYKVKVIKKNIIIEGLKVDFTRCTEE